MYKHLLIREQIDLANEELRGLAFNTNCALDTIRNPLRELGAGDEARTRNSAWEPEFSIVYFQRLQNAAEKEYVHALHAVHAVPELRVAEGRLRDDLSVSIQLTRRTLM